MIFPRSTDNVLPIADELHQCDAARMTSQLIVCAFIQLTLIVQTDLTAPRANSHRCIMHCQCRNGRWNWQLLIVATRYICLEYFDGLFVAADYLLAIIGEYHTER